MKILSLSILLNVCILVSLYAQQGQTADRKLQFTKQQIASESYESVGVFDVNNNGHLDIVSGAFWYEGPDFWKIHPTGAVVRYGQYWDDFSTIPMDVNGNGRTDFITGGWFSENIRWYENPGDNSGWQEHIIDHTGNVETTRAWDVNGDGYKELVPNNPNDSLKFYKLDRNDNGEPLGSFTKFTVAASQGHGLGFGDVNGNGRGDFIVSNGWLESPSNGLDGTWTLHEEFDLGSASIPILVVDVNGNGKNDLIVGQAHDYGLYWYEQSSNHLGEREWIKHSIDTDNSQFHTMEWVDIDGDGNSELITGKRYRAHNDRDPGANDPLGLYYYKWNGEEFIKHKIVYGPLGIGKGTGIYFTVTDLNDSGYKDIIVAGKDGLYVFYNEGFE